MSLSQRWSASWFVSTKQNVESFDRNLNLSLASKHRQNMAAVEFLLIEFTCAGGLDQTIFSLATDNSIHCKVSLERVKFSSTASSYLGVKVGCSLLGERYGA
eukprot:TRINITY_DN3735_c0_g1_i11.p1 TRINITY_DN3735_c0_g1~~TRINITY_DN3735_c0_g1_i11.p1  ORF type:complete len:102 (+),score=16.35 TRINITY_DN3735_c0_g1_i11:58-363(+)